MKPNLLALVIPNLLVFSAVSFEVNAQPPSAVKSNSEPHVRYAIVDLGTLGGNFTQGYGISETGHIAAGSTLPDGTLHGALWSKFTGLVDLGTLGGPNSVADTPNGADEVPVISEVTGIDPYAENFCLFFTNHLCLGAVWKDGVLKALKTLGGHNAMAWALNDGGEVAGVSETREKDPACAASIPSQVFRYEAVVWDSEGEIHELRPLAGDTVGFGFAINNSGQVVGASGSCANTSPPPGPNGPHAVMWEKDGTPVDLGSLAGPGTEPNEAASINDKGEVVGGSMAKDGTVHAFLWTRTTGMMDLGAFPGAMVTVAGCCNTNNNRGQIVGFAIDGATGNFRTFLWQHWHYTDLNTLIPANSGWYLQNAASINDAGEITGWGLIDGNAHGFLAIPCDADHAENAVCAD